MQYISQSTRFVLHWVVYTYAATQLDARIGQAVVQSVLIVSNQSSWHISPKYDVVRSGCKASVHIKGFPVLRNNLDPSSCCGYK